MWYIYRVRSPILCKRSILLYYSAYANILGVSLRAGLLRGIFLGATKRTASNLHCTAPRKDTLRISLTRFASCIEKISPAITSAPRVTTACAPGRCAEIWSNSQSTNVFRPLLRIILQNFIVENGNFRKHFYWARSPTITEPSIDSHSKIRNDTAHRNHWMEAPAFTNKILQCRNSCTQMLSVCPQFLLCFRQHKTYCPKHQPQSIGQF